MESNKNAKNEKLSGIIPPIITPLKKNGDLDKEGLKRVMEHCIKGGVNGIFAMGSTGEAMRVSRNTWKETIKAAINITDERVPVFCGVVDSSTYRTIENIREIEQEGAKFVVVTAPFYIQNTCQAEIIRHFEQICASTKLKVIAYNIPSMTSSKILPESFLELSKIENLVAIKDSSADWEHFQRILFLLENEDISVFNGAEELCSAAMIFGADGCVPGLACFYPELFASLYTAAKSGDIETAYLLQKKVWEIRKALFVGKSWLSAMKYISKKIGLSADFVSTPIEPLTVAEKERINSILELNK